MEKEREGQNAWVTPLSLLEQEVPAQEVKSGEEALGMGSGKMLKIRPDNPIVLILPKHCLVPQILTYELLEFG